MKFLFSVEFERSAAEDWDFARRRRAKTPEKKLQRQLTVEFQADKNFHNFPIRGKFAWSAGKRPDLMDVIHQGEYTITVTLAACGTSRTDARKVLRTNLQAAYDGAAGVAGLFQIKD